MSHPAKDKTQEELHEEIKTLKAVAIASAEAVYHYRLISRSINRDEDTLIKWRKDDPEFSERLEEARFRFINKQVRKSKPEFLLERLEPDVFKQRTEQDNTGEITHKWDELSDEQLDQAIEARKNRAA